MKILAPPLNARSWVPPPGTAIKVNVDASILEEQGAAAAVIKNFAGHILCAEARCFPCLSVAHAEVEAFLLGFKMVAEMENPAQVEGDAKGIVDAILGLLTPTWKISSVIDDCRSFLSSDLLLAISPGRQTKQHMTWPGLHASLVPAELGSPQTCPLVFLIHCLLKHRR